MSMGDQLSDTTSISENFKGILLSERPAEVKQRTKKSTNVHPPFLPSGKVEDLAPGLCPSQEELNRNYAAKLNRSMQETSPSAVTKHKQWLKEFGEQKLEQKLETMEAALLKEESRRKFAESQALLRQAIRECDINNSSGLVDLIRTSSNSMTSLKDIVDSTIKLQQTMKATADDNKNISSTTVETGWSKKDAKTKKNKDRPIWTLTEAEYEERKRQEEEELGVPEVEEEELLAFVKNLNYDKFIDDFEVKEALAILQDRIKELEKEIETDQIEDEHSGDSENIDSSPKDRTSAREARAAATRALIAKLQKKAQKLSAISNGGAASHDRDWNEKGPTAKQRDMIKAHMLLQKVQKLRNVHSRASIAAVMDDLKSSRSGTSKSVTFNEASLAKPIDPIAPPVVAVHSHMPAETDHHRVSTLSEASPNPAGERVLLQLKKSKDYVQNLPYMYRCPSI